MTHAATGTTHGRSTVQWVALVFGIGFLVATAAGFAASGASMDPNPETAPKAFGLFPVNVVHNLVHLVFGIWGLMAARSFGAAKRYTTVSGAIYLVLVGLGYVAPTGFGLLPLGGADPLLHVVLGVPLLAAGLTARAPTTGNTV